MPASRIVSIRARIDVPLASGPVRTYLPTTMLRIVRTSATLGVLSSLVLLGYNVAATTEAAVASAGSGAALEGGAFDGARSGLSRFLPQSFSALGVGYSLSSLKNLRRSVDYIQTQYVDPDRFDYPGMLTAALTGVERRVPGVLTRLEGQGSALHIAVGNYSTVLTVQRATSFVTLEDTLQRVAAILEAHVDAKEIPPAAIEYAMINGILSTLDPHSVFLPPESAKKMEEDNDGEFGGLGITIQTRNGQLGVEYPLEDTPAFRAGLKAGDQILRIEGESTLNMDLDDAVSKMRGAPGTAVTITINRTEFNQPKDVSMVRGLIKPSAVWSKLLDGNIAYIRISGFHGQVKAQLDEELAKLQREAGSSGVKGAVLDMRDNPGGYLHEAIAVSDTFLSSGEIVSTVERDGRNRDVTEAKPDATDISWPMAVLMSGNSASAAEIVAGALRNNERAVVIGERSFGKGSVQNLWSFATGDAQAAKLKLTTARYLTPGDRSIQNVGIPADIQLDRSFVYPPKPVKDLPGEMSGPRVGLFYRDGVLREADLAGHLNSAVLGQEPTVYSVRYLAPDPDGDDGPRTDRADVTKDFEVLFARDVLLGSHGRGRADVLKDASSVVATRQRVELGKIEAAFRAQGIDWSGCVNVASPVVEIALVAGKSGTLEAGALETLSVSVTNSGETPLCQTLVKAKSADENLDGLEFYLGRIEPGATRTVSTKARLPKAYPTDVAGIQLTLEDATRSVLATTQATVNAHGPDLPQYGWAWAVSDKEGGNGDGVLQVGETLTVTVTPKNVGAGAGGKASFDIRKGEGVGRSVEVVAGKSNFDVEHLAVGASGTGELSFKVSTAPSGGPDVPMSVRMVEAELYDYAGIEEAGFYDAYVQEYPLALTIGQALPKGAVETPTVKITRVPASMSASGEVTISGVATDGKGIRDVIVYRGDQKLAYAGGGDGTPLTSVPFSATTPLEEGRNVLVVYVRNSDGLVTTRSVSVFRPGTGGAGPVPGEAGRMR